MQLTAVGRVLLPRALILVRETRLAKEEVNSLRGLTTGTIRLGAIASVGCYFLPGVIESALKKSPGIRVQVVEDVWEKLESALVNYEVDLVLGVHKNCHDQVTAIEACQWTDDVEIVVGANHRLLKMASVSIQDVLHEPWAFLPRDTEPFARLDRVLGASGFSVPSLAIETTSISLLKSLVAKAGYVSWMNRPMYVAEAQAGLIAALPVAGTQEMRRLTVFRRKAGILPEPANRLLHEIRSFCQR